MTRNPDSFVHPYPFNRYFKSQSLLCETFREEIYTRITHRNHSIRQVSAALSVSTERVPAVVRLMQVVKDHVPRGGKSSTLLTKALDQMLNIIDAANVTDGRIVSGGGGFENIQQLPIHSLAGRETFFPTSDSSEFTTAYAGKESRLPPADVMVPHPDLVTLAKERFKNVLNAEWAASQEERDRMRKSRRKAERGREDERKRKEKVLEVGR
ncbi:eukaryotic mitochondrial regulator protein-domain-containing protein [Tuber indicum]|nr:eukaryotic mitochondrial regulator protein-domain-containing protein [Tuber indicum]